MTDDSIDLTDGSPLLGSPGLPELLELPEPAEPAEVVAAPTPHVPASPAVASLARAYQRAAWDLACGPRHPRASCSPSR